MISEYIEDLDFNPLYEMINTIIEKLKHNKELNIVEKILLIKLFKNYNKKI